MPVCRLGAQAFLFASMSSGEGAHAQRPPGGRRTQPRPNSTTTTYIYIYVAYLSTLSGTTRQITFQMKVPGTKHLIRGIHPSLQCGRAHVVPYILPNRIYIYIYIYIYSRIIYSRIIYISRYGSSRKPPGRLIGRSGEYGTDDPPTHTTHWNLNKNPTGLA